MSVYQRSETYYHWITFKDRDNKNYAPSTVSITITNPCGVVRVPNEEMTKDVDAEDAVIVGVYYYPYNLPEEAVYGEWDVKVVAAEVGESSTFKDKFYILPWDAVEQIRELSGITSKKSVSDDAIARIIWGAYKEVLDLVHKLRKNETFLCNPDDGAWIDGTNKVFAVKNPPIADFNGDGVVSGADGTDCDSDITLLWEDEDSNCSEGKVVVNNAECGNVTLTQRDDSALPSSYNSATVTYHSEWYPFKLDLLKKATVYLAAYECAIRFTELSKTTQADLSPSIIKFSAQRKELYRKYRDVLRLIKRPVVAGGMLPGDN